MAAIITCKEITKSFSFFDGKENKTIKALDSVSLDIESSSFTVITGSNASGKTLLMNIISGLIKEDSGNVFICGNKVDKLSDRNFLTAVVFQDPVNSILGDLAIDDVFFSVVSKLRQKKRKIKKNEIENEAFKYLDKTMLRDSAYKRIENLSSGQKRRLLLSSALALDREVLFLDEPYSNLDYLGVKELNRILLDLKKESRTIILITHEIEKCLALADKLIILNNGKLAIDEKPSLSLLKRFENFNIRNPIQLPVSDISDIIWI